MAKSKSYRCIHCAEYHEGNCKPSAIVAFRIDCFADILDELAGEPPEPGGRRWLIERGEYPPLDIISKIM
jgi:hypothetical protein